MNLESIKAALDERDNAIADRLNAIERRVATAAMTAGAPIARGDDSLPTKPEERRALETVLRKWIAGDAPGLARAIDEFESKAGRAGVDPDGGHFLGIQPGPIVRKIAEFSPIVGMANSIVLRTGDSVEGLEDLGSFVATWVGEESARPETATSTVGKYRIELRELYSQPKFTQKLLDTADIDVTQWAIDKIAEAFATAEEQAMISGDGISRWRGFTTYPTAATADSARGWGTFEHIGTGSASGFGTGKADVLIDTISKLRPRYRNRAAWFMSQSTLAMVRKLKESTSDQYIWQPGLTAGEPDRLLGFPVVLCNSLPAIESGSLSVWFGSMADAYLTIRRPGVRLITDALTDKPHVRLYSFARSGGGVVNTEALKAIRFA